LQLLSEEKEARKKIEKCTVSDTERMWTSFKKSFNEELKQMRDAHVVCLLLTFILPYLASQKSQTSPAWGQELSRLVHKEALPLVWCSSSSLP